ncbi:MAG TPA: BON domain-containing protein [Isosphaeraceae bacterium]|nr:BON domain-containing protein [Isosphaeraceae bacterium]
MGKGRMFGGAMGRELSFLKGLGLGAGLMYYLDPGRGRGRRALVRDQLVHLMHELDEVIEAGSRDLGHRARGMMVEFGSMFGEGAAPDDVLVARVRSKMGRYVSHPGAIDVSARAGRVTLRGPILAGEVDHLLRAVAGVRGVAGVEDRLEVHEHAGRLAALQGGIPRTGERAELWQRTWSPATRLVMGAAGGLLALKAVRRGGVTGLALGALGVGLVAQGLTNPATSGRQGNRSGTGRRHTEIQPADMVRYSPSPSLSMGGGGI